MININQSIINVIEKNARLYPEKIAYRFLNDMLVETSLCSYSDLIKKAKNVAGYLIDKSAQGERVLLLFNPGLDFIIAFFACLYANCVPVPCYSARVVVKNLKRFLAIIEDTDARFVLTDEGLSEQVTEHFLHRNIKTLYFSQADQNHNTSTALPQITAEDIAFLQYTSGSTAQPKGVIVTHKNILHNETLIQHSFQLDADSTVVGWLPFFHDMGLIGNILQPVFCGGTSVLMAPTTFLRKPLNWLQTISKYKAVCSGGPNFSYDFCAERITEEEINTLDLSSWNVAFNGSEVVQATTLNRFYNKFSKAGFNMESFLPCYGMAEATLFVTGCPHNEKPLQATFDEQSLAKARIQEQPEGRVLVSSGTLNDQFQIKIIDPVSQTEIEHQIGEICIAGESVSEGYWRKTTYESRYQEYHKTGDLGFIYKNQLFITGRLKELIIIRGKNYVPQDIEQLVQKNPVLMASAGACFSVDHYGEERLVVVQEVKRQYLKQLAADEVMQSIQDNITAELGIAVYAIVLIRPLTLTKTSSGKIMRLNTKSQYLTNQLQIIAQWQQQFSETSAAITIDELSAHAEDTEKTLELLFKKIAQVQIDDHNKQHTLQGLGFDSVAITELSGYLHELYSCNIGVEQLYNQMTFNQLLLVLAEHRQESAVLQEEVEIII